MIMQQGDQHSNLTFSYLALRKAVGWIGILLPFVLMLGGRLIFREDFTLKNISLYYYTGMRNVYVGALCSIGLFLFSTRDMISGITGQVTWQDSLL